MQGKMGAFDGLGWYITPSEKSYKDVSCGMKNDEATMDMLEQYSYIKYGTPKPLIVSEFGASTHDYQGRWTPYRDWLHMKSVNAMMMQFMERPQIINKVVNFLIIKATWGYSTSNGYTYPHRLMRKANEAESYTGDWVYTEHLKHFQLWSDVKGKRVDCKSSDPDVLCDTYIDGNDVYVILNNLDFEEQKIALKLNETKDLSIDSIELKQLYLGKSHRTKNQNTARLAVTKYGTSLPHIITLEPEGTMIIRYTYNKNISIDEYNKEKKYYAEEYLKTIEGRTKNTFNIKHVMTETTGEATLKLAVGRAHTANTPTIRFNGTNISYPDDFRGGTQDDRPSFYGVIEIPVPYSILQEDNVIEITYPDYGGKISSVTLQVNSFSKTIERFTSTAIEESKAIDVSLYPNPAKNVLKIESEKAFTDATFYNIQGVEIYSTKVAESSVDLRELKDGIYIMRLRNKKSNYNTRISIIH